MSWGHLPEARLQWADSDQSHQASHHPAGQSLYVGDALPPLPGLLTLTALGEVLGRARGGGQSSESRAPAPRASQGSGGLTQRRKGVCVSS